MLLKILKTFAKTSISAKKEYFSRHNYERATMAGKQNI